MNLKEVAKRAKVSTATVSRVLNNPDLVKTATRARVLKAISELKFHPNLLARNLAGGKSRTIGMIVSNLENPFFFDVFHAAEIEAHARNFEIVVANTNYQEAQLLNSVRLMIGRRVAGLIVIVSEMEPHVIQELIESKLPVVFCDVGTTRQNISNIRIHYHRGIEKVVDYLHDLGHRRMAFVSHHSKLGPISIRESAFRETAARYAPQVKWMTAADADGMEGGRLAAREILASGFKPTSIICVNDIMAVGVLRELRESGLRVPQDVSVTGFDNIRLSEFAFPALTTVHIPRDRVGQIAIHSLLPDDEPPRVTPRDIVIDPEFVVRESTGPAKKT